MNIYNIDYRFFSNFVILLEFFKRFLYLNFVFIKFLLLYKRIYKYHICNL